MRLVLIFLTFVVTSFSIAPSQDLHKRPKRWINFPKGSSLQLVYCWLISTYGTADGIFTVGITVGLAWEIPQDLRNTVFGRERSFHDDQRRELHSKVKRFIDQQGQNGTACVKKAICDASQISHDKKLPFMQTILHTIFKFDSSGDELAGCDEPPLCSISIVKTSAPTVPFAM